MDWEGLGAARGYVADVVRQAAREVRDRGWVQGRFVEEATGAVDAVQALGLAAGIDVAASHRRELRLPAGSCVLLGAALEAVESRLGVEALTAWNDREGQSAEEVCRGLEDAADRLEA